MLLFSSPKVHFFSSRRVYFFEIQIHHTVFGSFYFTSYNFDCNLLIRFVKPRTATYGAVRIRVKVNEYGSTCGFE